MLLQTLSKNHIILWEKNLKTTLKIPNDLEKLHPISQKKGKKKFLLGMQLGVFCQNLDVTGYALENYSNFKNKFLFNNDSIPD